MSELVRWRRGVVFQEKNTDRSRLRKDENMSSVRSAVWLRSPYWDWRGWKVKSAMGREAGKQDWGQNLQILVSVDLTGHCEEFGLHPVNMGIRSLVTDLQNKEL